jgi:hypothetical protein
MRMEQHEQLKALLAKLGDHFKVSTPELRLCNSGYSGNHGRYKPGIIFINEDSFTPYEDTLVHEFAHRLADHRAAMTPSKKAYRPHGREFFHALLDVVEFSYVNPNFYGWQDESEQIIRWWNKHVDQLEASSAA